jgi:HK97 family phage prohead protease
MILEGTIKGYLSVFGVKDSYGDIVMPGAFKDSLSKLKPKMLWQHKGDAPIGYFEKLEEDNYGLYFEAKLCDTEKGRDAKALLGCKAIEGMSIGYRIAEGGAFYDKTQDAYLLTKIDLIEGSVVTYPANDKAIAGLKTAVNKNWLGYEITN